jgi:hypothetical protein
MRTFGFGVFIVIGIWIPVEALVWLPHGLDDQGTVGMKHNVSIRGLHVLELTVLQPCIKSF